MTALPGETIIVSKIGVDISEGPRRFFEKLDAADVVKALKILLKYAPAKYADDGALIAGTTSGMFTAAGYYQPAPKKTKADVRGYSTRDLASEINLEFLPHRKLLAPAPDTWYDAQVFQLGRMQVVRQGLYVA